MALRSVQPSELQMDQPLLLALSRDRAAVFAPWWRDTLVAAALLLLAAVGRLGGAHRRATPALAGRGPGVATAAREAADSERLRLALNGGDLALWDARLPSGEIGGQRALAHDAGL